MSRREATQAALDRIAAADAGEAVLRGEAGGALYGVPVTAKVDVDMRGRATTNGVVTSGTR